LTTETTLPVSLESERAVLGAILLESQQLATVLRFALIEDFSLSSHREILRTIVGLDSRGIVPDLVTVVAELDQVRKLESVGGAVYVEGYLMAYLTAQTRRHTRPRCTIWPVAVLYTRQRGVRVRQLSKVNPLMMSWADCSKKSCN
jgi:hypothetical protein